MRDAVSWKRDRLIKLDPYEIDPSAPPPKTEPAKEPGKDPPKDPPKTTPDPVVAAQEQKRKAVSQGNLSRLTRALQTYVSANQTLPPPAICAKDGTPLLSWRVAILPYIGKTDVYQRFKLDEPWDSPNNRELLQFIPKEFVVPDAPLKEPYTTYYQLFVGPGADEPGPKGRRLAAVADGPSHTIAIAEGAEAVPWTAPVDLPFSPDGPLPKLGGLFSDGFNAGMFNGSARFFTKKIYADDKALRALIGWNDGEVVNLRPYQESILAPLPKDDPAAGPREVVRKTHSQINLRALGMALRYYHNANNAFPPYAIADKDGKPLLSWRVALLPYLDEELLYKKFKLDEPWDSPNNRALLPLLPQVFEAPALRPMPTRRFIRCSSAPAPASTATRSTGFAFRMSRRVFPSRCRLWRAARRSPGPSRTTSSSRRTSRCRSWAASSRRGFTPACSTAPSTSSGPRSTRTRRPCAP